MPTRIAAKLLLSAIFALASGASCREHALAGDSVNLVSAADRESRRDRAAASVPCSRRVNERTPFWMSKRECDVAAEKGDIYRVRRVFHFRNHVKMFDIAPPPEARLLLTPTTFMAAPR